MQRIVAPVLWFAAVWFAWEVAWSVAGVPRVVGPMVGAIVAIWVALDPAGLFWASASEDAASPAAPDALTASHAADL